MSRQRVAAHVRAQLAAACAGWVLVARCDRCLWTGARLIKMMAARWMDATIGAVIERLACTGCTRRFGCTAAARVVSTDYCPAYGLEIRLTK